MGQRAYIVDIGGHRCLGELLSVDLLHLDALLMLRLLVLEATARPIGLDRQVVRLSLMMGSIVAL